MHRNAARFTLAGLAAVALALLGVAAPASAATVTVGPGGTYTTIQDAVAAAISGDTITVEAGNYTGAVVVPTGKSLTITGAVGAVLAGSFTLNAPSTITGFTVHASAVEPVAADATFAVSVTADGVGSTISNNTLDNATNVVIVTLASGSAGAPTTVSGNTITGFYNNAIFLNQNAHVVVTGNTIDNSAGGTLNGYGVNLAGGSFITVTGNTIKGVDNAVVVHGQPIPATDVTVSGNEITNTGSSAVVIGNANVSALDIASNTISGVGLGAGGATSSAIKFGNSGFDIVPAVPPIDDISVESNTIANTPRGITVADTVRLVDDESLAVTTNTFASVAQYALSVDPAVGANVTAVGNDLGGAALIGNVVVPAAVGPAAGLPPTGADAAATLPLVAGLLAAGLLLFALRRRAAHR
jgi:putative cofactor-binding repeat protein